MFKRKETQEPKIETFAGVVKRIGIMCLEYSSICKIVFHDEKVVRYFHFGNSGKIAEDVILTKVGDTIEYQVLGSSMDIHKFSNLSLSAELGREVEILTIPGYDSGREKDKICTINATGDSRRTSLDDLLANRGYAQIT